MKCPTCESAKEDCCCGCGKEIPKAEQLLAPDPYGEEVVDDERLHLQCENCSCESAGEI